MNVVNDLGHRNRPIFSFDNSILLLMHRSIFSFFDLVLLNSSLNILLRSKRVKKVSNSKLEMAALCTLLHST